MESNRQRKVAQIIQEDFAELFRKQGANSQQSILVSVSDVKVTADLGIAKIYLSIFPQEHRTAVMKEIEENKAQYRNFIGQKMAKQVRVIPQLNFYLDTTLDDVEKLEREGVVTSFYETGESKIELLEASNPESPISKFIDKKGEGIHHLAFGVENIYNEVKRLKNEGFQFISEEPKEGADNKLVVFLHPKSTNGVLVELCQEKQ